MYGRRSVRAILLAGVAFAAAAARTTAQGLHFTRLGLEEGLSQWSADAITQDADGFLWVGTQNGADRYDGVSFRSSWMTDGRISPVSYGQVTSLFSDAEGHLWVGLRGLGLYLYDRQREDFDGIPVSGYRPAMPPKEYYGFAQARDTIFVATDQGIGFIQGDSAGAELHLRDPPDDGCDRAVTALWAATDTLWTGTVDGCVLTNPPGVDGRNAVVVRLGVRITAIGPGPESRVYVGTESKGLVIFDRTGGMRSAAGNSHAGNATDRVTSVLATHNGDTWIGTLGGLGWMPSGSSDTIWFGMGSEAAGALPHDAVESLYEDRSGVFWVGTWMGLARLDRWYRSIRFIPERLDADGEPVGGVVSILPEGPDSLLTGSLGGALTHVARSAVGPGVLEAGLPRMTDVYSMARGRDGSLWVASIRSGVYHRTPFGWRVYHLGETGAGDVPSKYAESILVDHSGIVWVGTNSAGLYTYDLAQDRFRAFRTRGPSYGLDTAYVWPIRQDARGALWFGKNHVGDGGIFRLGADRRSLDFFPTTDSAGERPNAGRVLTILLAGDSVVWFGTQGAGLGRLDPRTGQVRFYTTREGLPHDNVEGILEDRTGRLWISTNRGLARFDPGSGEAWVFKETSGIQGSPFFANSAFESEDGVLYFGGINGITAIDPSGITPRATPPPLALVRFLVRGVERSDITNVSARSGVELGPHENFFTIQFAGLDFGGEGGIRFRYRLQDLEKDWVDAGSDRSARYTDVRPGRYRFFVQARSGGSSWSPVGLSIPIVVRPPYYRTAWFRVSLVLVLGGLTAALLLYRRSQHERVRTMRLQIAEELHDDIGANLSAIALKSDLIRRVARADARGTPVLTDIQRLAQDTMQKVREMIWVVREEHDTVQGLVTRMEDAAGTLLGGVVDYSLTVDPELPDRSLGMAVRQDFYRVFKEALQNVMKHAGRCRVIIRVSFRPPDLVVSVSDDGDGFDERLVSPGTGLKLMRARRRRGVRVTVSSAPGSGTDVEIAARV